MRGLVVQDLINKDPSSKYGNLSPDSEPLTQPQEVVAMRIFRNKPTSDKHCQTSCDWWLQLLLLLRFFPTSRPSGTMAIVASIAGYVDTDDNVTDMCPPQSHPLRDAIPTTSADILWLTITLYFEREYDEDDGKRTPYYCLKIGSTRQNFSLNTNCRIPALAISVCSYQVATNEKAQSTVR